MQYTKLGKTGLDVSRICVGAMSFGVAESGRHTWTLDEDRSRQIITAALDHGINFFDTANIYSDGTSEEILGGVLGDLGDRDSLVIATKVHGPTHHGPNGRGLSRKHIMTEVEASLRRLDTDYIDLYQIHRLDPSTPLEETLEALHDLVKSGKVRYLGASSMFAWELTKALYTADLRGISRFVSMQDHYNLLYREEEREMLPLCLDQGLGVLPWSPLARGRIARPWGEASERLRTDKFGSKLYAADHSDREIIDAVGHVAERHQTSRATVGLAWLLHQPGVTAPIVGATQTRHLDEAVNALDVELTERDLDELTSSYLPRRVSGF
ncbi:aldo/keto reductase [Citricoccus sp. NPDC055426]|uniref:aldo/keto reductase n=1 Tax=Citricoccus sp. NPDC055426 TaxID=3155536 RepID=UPI00341F7843